MSSPLWFRIQLLFSAYFPLYLILFIKFADFEAIYYSLKYWRFFKEFFFYDLDTIKGFLSVMSIVLFLYSLFCCFYIIREIVKTERKRIGQFSININNVESRDKDVLVYLMTYVLPLVSLNTQNIKEVIIFILLIVLIMWLSLYSDLLYINPLLTAFKRRLYAVETTNGKVIVISRKKNLDYYKGKELMCYRLEGKQILIDSPSREGS
ncbi:hypothetical protein DFO73_110188 [Cytobacillus oceanisediminis]|uniref:Uncharacterized protein n=1 Tax=Cytobacillus oceanisediminis TaxID=665099 RepID=A0A2V2ZZF2_9BACI|nr:hypothetical protein [Cytobacillus oceanisediminis]PWW26614.1 hypothetical protein DFO73_110188 [Cytobacillus oceanisediminis]